MFIEFNLVKSVEVAFEVWVKSIAWNKQVNCKNT